LVPFLKIFPEEKEKGETMVGIWITLDSLIKK